MFTFRGTSLTKAEEVLHGLWEPCVGDKVRWINVHRSRHVCGRIVRLLDDLLDDVGKGAYAMVSRDEDHISVYGPWPLAKLTRIIE